MKNQSIRQTEKMLNIFIHFHNSISFQFIANVFRTQAFVEYQIKIKINDT